MPLTEPLRRSALRDLLAEAFRVEERAVDWPAAVMGALVATAPLAIGLALDEVPAGVTAAIGGLNTALVVPRANLRARVWWGGLCAVASAGSLAVAESASSRLWVLLLATFVWVGGWAFLRAAGKAGALTGFAICAVFVILGGIPVGDTALEQRLLWYAMGALPALVLMIAVRRGPAGDPAVVARALRAVRDGVRRDPALHAHALRLAVAVTLATLLYRGLDLDHGYWVPLTVLAVLQPGEHATRVRAVQRALGTLGGALLIVAITLVVDDRWALVACAAAAAFWLYALDERGYFWLVVMLTPTALLMLSIADYQGGEIALERVGESTIGIVIGLAIAELARALGRPATMRAEP